ncbi:MAG TPA: aminotransferase class I/II-fold pyridoxal phosphate-dependent enzyme, partial [Blastocatellia bacterium]|nr:aminotransferase class I/II-fold pyridoxal phosphate-dependent enzyme [Blastocatellia bacterium]
EITVTCGSTEGMIAAMMATVNPGDEVIVFEPFYENYGPDAILSDARPRYVAWRAPDWNFDRDELSAAFSEKTKAIIVCNPNNPTGKVFTRDELEFIAQLCREHDALCFTDEIYEHILYPREGASVEHISMAQLEGMRERTVIVNSMSKTYSVTGWRVGYCIAPPSITNAIRKVHDFLTVGAAAPLQAAGAYALSLPPEYYAKLRADYTARRNLLLPVLEEAGFRTYRPDGAYYIMTDISGFGFKSDVEFTRHLIRDVGVACVPGSSFYSRPELGSQQVRFCFCKRDETLTRAAERLANLKSI